MKFHNFIVICPLKLHIFLTPKFNFLVNVFLLSFEKCLSIVDICDFYDMQSVSIRGHKRCVFVQMKQ